MDKKIIALLLISVIVAVSATSLSYYVMSQPNQTQNTPSPTPIPTPTPTPTEQLENPVVTTPSVPEFIVKYVDNSYYVPPTYGVDEYSGETVQIGGGFTVTNKSIEVTIKNQPLSYEIENYYGSESSFNFFYNVRYKGHFGDEWKELFGTRFDPYVVADCNSEYTVTTLHGDFGSGDKIDIQVEALIGTPIYSFIIPTQFTGKTSGWSDTQTIIIP